MLVVAQAFWCPKEGNADREYEDAFYPKGNIQTNVASFRFAIADGATETSFSGLWARLLVQGYCKGWISEGLIENGVSRLQRIWKRKVSKRPLPWYAEEKMRFGAFSSLLGLALASTKQTSTEYGEWSAISFGDSCLFQVRAEELITSFPLTESAAFNNYPLLISSLPARNIEVLERATIRAGCWESGDYFYLMTDALACWFLKEYELGEHPWTRFSDPIYEERESDFRDWIGELRYQGHLRNDDVTLYRINPILGDQQK